MKNSKVDHETISIRNLSKVVLEAVKSSKNGVTQDAVIQAISPKTKESEKQAIKKRVSEILSILVGSQNVLRSSNATYMYNEFHKDILPPKVEKLIKCIRFLINYHIFLDHSEKNSAQKTVDDSHKIKLPFIVLAGKKIEVVREEGDRFSCTIISNAELNVLSPGMIFDAMNFSIIEQTEYARMWFEGKFDNKPLSKPPSETRKYIYELLIIDIVRNTKTKRQS